MTTRDPFFQLDRFDKCEKVSSQKQFVEKCVEGDENITDLIFEIREIVSDGENPIAKLQSRHFENVSFSGVKLMGLEFINCHFKNCRFHFASFVDCRFHRCSFENTNMHKIEISGTFVDPQFFIKAIKDTENYANIGVHLFQTLMKNSRDEDQPIWESRARYQFKRWLRLQKVSDYKRQTSSEKMNLGDKIPLALPIIGDFFWGTLFGYGVRLRNYICTTLGIVALLTSLSWYFSNALGLNVGEVPINSLDKSLYFTVISLTTVGYGDITPSTELGRIFASFQGIIGFGLFGVLISMIYNKISA